MIILMRAGIQMKNTNAKSWMRPWVDTKYARSENDTR